MGETAVGQQPVHHHRKFEQMSVTFIIKVVDDLIRSQAIDHAAQMGEEVAACVRLRQGAAADEDDVRVFCRERIAHYRVPSYIRFVEAFPTTASGRMQKFIMRETMIRELGLVMQTTA